AWPALPASLIRRLARAYGTRARVILDGARTVEDLGGHFGADLYARELDYMHRHEWARTGDDALWRRSKLGLRLTAAEQAAVRHWFESAETEEQRLAGE
ncbi:MAG: glycerol-3-phosphate dehydrogenase C-terminal domain-containing protein, partial [Thalassobaculaceae bacterium]